ncbi:hypothetical protein [Lentibacillus persicus]|uniref:hypothetical protein n=1 Tax=Lentibacillus persicus TaxID=640948 RepID=UPI000B802BB8|nr:hypothetical protein [Lentibacillus persicus]
MAAISVGYSGISRGAGQISISQPMISLGPGLNSVGVSKISRGFNKNGNSQYIKRESIGGRWHLL